jgi:copper(I)-binding protein
LALDGHISGRIAAFLAWQEITVGRLFLALWLILPIASCGQPATLEVKNAWTRDTVGGSENAAVFMTITSPTADRLVAASTPVAKETDLMTMAGGSSAMEMKYLKDMAIPAGKTVSLNPAGWHVWLSELNHPLKVGETFRLSLQFAKAGERQVTVSVIAPAAAPPS